MDPTVEQVKMSAGSIVDGVQCDEDGAGGNIGTPESLGEQRGSVSPLNEVVSDYNSDTSIVPVSMTPPGGQEPIPTSSSSGQRAEANPSASKSLKRINVGKRKSRRKKTKFSVFPLNNRKSKRPKATLTAHCKYVEQILPEMLRELQCKKMCFAERNRKLGQLEVDLLKRVSAVSGLHVRGEDQVTKDEQQVILDELTSILEDIQELFETKTAELGKIRSGRLVAFCCPPCSEEKNKKTNISRKET